MRVATSKSPGLMYSTFIFGILTRFSLSLVKLALLSLPPRGPSPNFQIFLKFEHQFSNHLNGMHTHAMYTILA
jgi:hypothetical protein